MYRLTIVAGPNRGSSFMIREGENSIGRQAGNSIVLQSARVSKKHCTLQVSGESVVLEDHGSSNGTFVNGTLAKKKNIAPGDRISVGEYILEVDNPTTKKPKQALPVQGLGGAVAMPSQRGPAPRQGSHSAAHPGLGEAMAFPGGPASESTPKDLKEKFTWFMEEKVLPFFYGLNLKYEWHMLLVGLFGAFMIANLVISVQPLIESGNEAVMKESASRARMIAKLIVARNAPFLATRQESKLEIEEVLDKADGVQLAVLVTMDNRVLAPRRASNFLTDGPEAVFAVQARERFERKEAGVVRIQDSTVTAIEPVLVYDSAAGKNVAAAMAIVSIDTSLATPDIGEMGVVYSQTLILTGIIGALILFILYKLTLRPFRVLSDDMDKVLKGDLIRITREHRISELAPLWDLIDSTLQRVPKGTSSVQVVDTGPTIEELAAPVQMIGNLTKNGIVVCDPNRAVVYLNSVFEETSGIRSEMAVGQTLSSQAREQSFSALIDDLMERATSMGTASDDYDFSGVAYKIHVTSFPGPGGQPRGYVLATERQEG